VINAFRQFNQDKMYKELFMPTRKPQEDLFSIEPQPKRPTQLVPKSIGENTYEIAKKVEGMCT
jgi:hypothetical protein